MSHTQLQFSNQLHDIDWPKVTSWLSKCYWSLGISQQYVEQAATASTVVIGAFIAGQQVAYARVVSDTVRFAYLADVYVDEQHRHQGIARTMTAQLLQHPKLQHVVSTYLFTNDAHGVYQELGFVSYPNPEKFMVRTNPQALDFRHSNT
ncbi:GNAT family N-acetyltransferase [Deefgea piscis]|uniref:GNAT family N-acetyltransferase n=1 Tax=Deefgea piscis TaxID=2739061 RepID=UPI001C8144A6|nr:GNAT family N-acetyltransferase [Deefgea piscis]QZA82473.1 GNAT family N-acetyltransferase [Deefgea piscis]